MPEPFPGPPGPLGAVLESAGRCRFTVWAPARRLVEVHLLHPADRLVPLEPSPNGYHTAAIDGVAPGSLYLLRLDGETEQADPASRSQPRGVHGPSEVVSPVFDWTDAGFRPPAPADQVFYEIHVGTFTPEGTFDAATEHIESLRELGVTVISLMPVAQFPGARNWGYDGVFPFAVQDTYGGPRGLRRLVNACHARGLAVCLDVVYNHLGPEGAVHEAFGPYFTPKYTTPWGSALNFDGAESDQVRRHFIESALYFLEAFHADFFRVDAVHAVMDASARPFLAELTDALHAEARRLGRTVYAIAESDLNDARVLRPAEEGGFGFDAQWAEDFHNALHAFMTGERTGFYADFGSLGQVAIAYRRPFVYAGEYSVRRRRRHGNFPAGLSGDRFVVCTQNHDHAGNRPLGDRPGARLSFAERKLAACALLLGPYLPLLFMGQEYGETAPFPYFTDHGSPDLAEAVRAGRLAEMIAYGWEVEAMPDPQSPETFRRARLDRSLLEGAENKALRDLHAELLRLRAGEPALRAGPGGEIEAAVEPGSNLLKLSRRRGSREVLALLAFAGGERTPGPRLHAGRWRVLLDTEDPRWLGGGRPAPRNLDPGELSMPPKCCILLARTSGEPG